MLQGGHCDLITPLGSNALGLNQAVTCPALSDSNRREVICVLVLNVSNGGENCDDELRDQVGALKGHLLTCADQAGE